VNLSLCRAEYCWRQGGKALAMFAQATLGIDWNETSADGAITLLPVECIGLCKGAPCGVWGGRSLVKLTPAKLGLLLK
jgi:formate dehydrogenase subunit gamma